LISLAFLLPNILVASFENIDHCFFS